MGSMSIMRKKIWLQIMQKYKHKPTEIEAEQLTLDCRLTLFYWSGGKSRPMQGEPGIIIPTLEGDLHVNIGDYIVRGIAGEFYPVKKDIFEASYEKVT